jgi:hypothetical protein
MNEAILKNGVYRVEDAIAVPTGMIHIVIRDAITGKIKSDDMVKNMFVTAGKNAIASALQGTTSNNKGIITYCALGTSSVAPALSDTLLGTELYRKLVSVRSVANNVATFSTFFTTSEGNGTLREAGLFGDDATGVSGTGTLFCHAAISRTKSSSDTLSLSWAVTIG